MPAAGLIILYGKVSELKSFSLLGSHSFKVKHETLYYRNRSDFHAIVQHD